jgi:hypothetical protein
MWVKFSYVSQKVFVDRLCHVDRIRFLIVEQCFVGVSFLQLRILQPQVMHNKYLEAKHRKTVSMKGLILNVALCVCCS